MTFNETAKLKKKRVTWKRSIATLLGVVGIAGAATLAECTTGTEPTKNEVGFCETGTDANTNQDCRIEYTTGSLDLVWKNVLQEQKNIVYTEPEVVVFEQAVDSACGKATSNVGPFYCSFDKTIYLDTSFFKTLEEKYGFANDAVSQEYVIAHEYGHHIQQRLGVLQRSWSGPIGDDSLAVRTELQADCYAGIWATKADEVKNEDGETYLKQITEEQVKQAMSAAGSVGDDNIQTRAGYPTINPDEFSHGTSLERERWFLAGYRTGSMNACDTYNAADLDNPPALK